jgi:hypothetical protein
MNRLNWTDLSRKLVDRFDMIFLNDTIEAILGVNALAFFGKGVIPTKLIPTPFSVTMSGATLGGTADVGTAVDPDGKLIVTTIADVFTLDAPAGSLRWDLLTIRFARTNDTLINKPSNPSETCYMNLLDADTVQVIKGTPGVAAYPACPVTDVILAGIQIPAIAAVGTDCTVDLLVRDLSQKGQMQIHEMTASGAVLASDDLIEINGIGEVQATLVSPALMAGMEQTFVLVHATGTGKLMGTVSGQVNPTLDAQWDRMTIYSNGNVWRVK